MNKSYQVVEWKEIKCRQSDDEKKFLVALDSTWPSLQDINREKDCPELLGGRFSNGQVSE